MGKTNPRGPEALSLKMPPCDFPDVPTRGNYNTRNRFCWLQRLRCGKEEKKGGGGMLVPVFTALREGGTAKNLMAITSQEMPPVGTLRNTSYGRLQTKAWTAVYNNVQAIYDMVRPKAG
jgi:hypothetical protein